MASSGSINFSLTRNEIINDALVHCQAIAQGEIPSAEETSFAARQLNRMIKTFQATGVHLWTRRVAFLFTAPSQGRYTLGPGSSDHAAEQNDATNSTLSADAASGAATVGLVSVTGIAVADNIGVVLTDGTIDWDTVASIASLTVTLTGTLSGAAAAGQPVYTYTTLLNRPLRVLSVQRASKDDVDTPIAMVSHDEYQRLPNKTITGLTNEVYYQPQIPSGFIHLWPEPETAADRIRMTCDMPIEDFDATSDTADLPQEWLDTLTWNLAKKLMPGYGTPQDTAAMIRDEANSSYATLAAWDAEPEDTSFAPDFERGA